MTQFTSLPGVSVEQLGQLAALFNIGTVVLPSGASGKVTQVNAAWARLARCAPGCDWLETIHPQDRRAVEGALQAASSDGSAELECRLTGGEGPVVWAHLRACRMLAADGSIEGLVVGISDITAMHVARLREQEKLEESMLSTVEALAAMEAVRDLYTAGHQSRVGTLAGCIGAELGFDHEACAGLRLSAVLHDVGKVGIPFEVLTKPAALSATEMAIMREHAEKGFAILRNVKSAWPLARVAGEHHECLDGSGYPRGLRGDAILLESQIAAVADIVDAMTSHRPYRAGVPMAVVLETIHGMRRTRLHADAVDACVRVIESGRWPARQADVSAS